VAVVLIIIDVTGCAEAQPGAMGVFLGPNVKLDGIAARAGTATFEIRTTVAGTVRKTGARA
jgi:alanine racemase